MTQEPELNYLYIGLFVANLIVVSIIGLFIYIQHFKAMVIKPEMVV